MQLQLKETASTEHIKSEQIDILSNHALCCKSDLASTDVKRQCGVQARLISSQRAKLNVYDVDSHRLALYMDSAKVLLPTIKKVILQEMGLWEAATTGAFIAEQFKKGPFRLP